jgi:quinol monooxygenase YgiN
MNIKNILNSSLVGLGLVGSSITTATPVEQDLHQASYIQFKANSEQGINLADFLKNGATLVRETEPQTLFWFALQGEKGTFGIFDVFHDDAGRTAHFAGKVAAALHDSANTLINGGWDKGVVPNVQNSEILSTNSYKSEAVLKATKASYIVLKAKPGKEKELETLLREAAHVVSKTEPGTSFWLALKLDNTTYAIFDTFADEGARNAHFEGAVAGSLKNNADHLIVGEWQQGVLNNIHHFNILASS